MRQLPIERNGATVASLGTWLNPTVRSRSGFVRVVRVFRGQLSGSSHSSVPSALTVVQPLPSSAATAPIDLANRLANRHTMPASKPCRTTPARKSGPRKTRANPLPAVVNVHEAKTQLSRLLVRVEAGEEIIIARAGHPFARLVPLAAPAAPAPRTPGRFKGLFGPLTTDEALAPLPPEYSGLVSSPTDPLARP